MPLGHLRQHGRLSPRARPSSSCSSSANPDEAGPNNDLGYLYAEQGKNLEKAESMIRKALQERPDELRLSRQPGLGAVQAGQGQGGAREPHEGRGADEGGRWSGTGASPTPPSSSTWATSTSSSTRSTRPKMPGARPSRPAEEAIPPDKRAGRDQEEARVPPQARPVDQTVFEPIALICVIGHRSIRRVGLSCDLASLCRRLSTEP